MKDTKQNEMLTDREFMDVRSAVKEYFLKLMLDTEDRDDRLFYMEKERRILEKLEGMVK